jgi:Zn-dependent M28 family amino/carboxypeptidase
MLLLLLLLADPTEPKPETRIAPRPSGAIARSAVDEKAIRTTIEELVACGTRSSLSSWDDAKRGIGCARDKIVRRLRGTRLNVVVDRFEAQSPRTHDKPARLENVMAILPGTDFPKVAFVVSGHFDSIPSSPMDEKTDAPGADDDASGVAVSLECARLLGHGKYRSTIVFATVSGEEQGLLGGKRLLEWLRSQGYTVGGMLDDDIVGADSAEPHRIRLFSGGGPDGIDSPSRDLARTVEEIVGADAVRMVFRLDRLARAGDHRPFVEAGLPAVRFTEPLENYDHEHQNPRVENGREFGDFSKFLSYRFIGDVARVNAEVLRQLALAPLAPEKLAITGGVTPDAKLTWTAADDSQRAGFEILWRETTDPRWSVHSVVDAAGEHVLKGVSTDNHFFAVRSVGKNGARSIMVAAQLPPPKPF